MVERNISTKVQGLASTFPVLTLTGPRQSGKTTLCRTVFADYDYVSLERPDVRERALADPVGFLRSHPDRAILDEIQRAPQLLSWLQGEVDRDRRPGRFVLTGSHNLLLMEGISQTLAGRTSVVNLLPFSRDEVERFEVHPTELEDSLFTGSYPPILDEGHAPGDWLAAYVSTYVERDVRQVLGIKDLRAFQHFMRLCAARTGQVLNMASLAADAGVSAVTVRSWLGVLEASFLITLLPAWFTNPRKRLVKSPKLHFLDSGLACWLLGIRSAADLELHYARGAIFESWLASEILKSRLNRGLPAALHHVRTQKQEELDLFVDDGPRKALVEAKAGRTVATGATRPLLRWRSILGELPGGQEPSLSLVYGGEERFRLGEVEVIPWREVPRRAW